MDLMWMGCPDVASPVPAGSWEKETEEIVEFQYHYYGSIYGWQGFLTD